MIISKNLSHEFWLVLGNLTHYTTFRKAFYLFDQQINRFWIKQTSQSICLYKFKPVFESDEPKQVQPI